MRISDWSSDVCSSDLLRRWRRWRGLLMTEELLITIPDDVQAFLNGLNAGDVGFEGFPEGRLLHFEGFSDQCWQAHEDRFGVDGAQEGVAIVEYEIIADWLGRHPGASLLASGWEGGCEHGED